MINAIKSGGRPNTVPNVSLMLLLMDPDEKNYSLQNYHSGSSNIASRLFSSFLDHPLPPKRDVLFERNP